MYQQAQVSDPYIDQALRSSFAAIKKDIDQLRSGQSTYGESLRQLREQLALLPADKVGALQVKITDLAEDLERMRKLQDQLDNLNRDITAIQKALRADFKDHEKHAREEAKEYRKSVDTDIKTLNKKLESHLVRFDEKLTESLKLVDQRTADEVLVVRREVSKFSEMQKEYLKIKEQLAQIQTQMAQLTKQGMALFEERAKVYGERVAQHLHQVDGKVQQHLNAQSAVVNKQLNEQVKQVNAQMQNVKTALERFANDQRDFTKHAQKQLDEKISRGTIEKLVEDINREFNTLKQLMVKDFQRIDEEFKKHGTFIREKKFKSAVTEIHDECDRLKDRVNYIDTSKISKGYFDQQLDDLKGDMAAVKDALLVLKATAMSDRTRKDELVAELRRVEAQRSPARRRAYRGMSIMASVLLLTALTLAIVAAGTYFTWGATSLYWTLSYTGAAVLTFLIGLILQITVWRKRRVIQPEAQMRLTEVESGDAPF